MASAGTELYRIMQSKRKAIVLAMAVGTVILFFMNLVLSIDNYTVSEAFCAVFQPDSAPKPLHSIIWYFRMPETMFALLVGTGLAMAGAEMQTILNNPLAEPYTLGISMSAAFGAALVLGLGFGSSYLGEYACMVMAFVMAMVACFIIYSVARRPGTSRNTIILLGVALLFLFQSLVNLIQVISGPNGTSAIAFWMFGSLSRYNDTKYIVLLAIIVILVGLLFAKNMWKLTAMKMGDAKVLSLGIDVSKVRKTMILGISVVTAACVSFTGTIGFIGLVGPHIARILVGDDQRFMLPLSALCGSMFLLASAVVIKIFDISVIPVGVITSLVGVPFFIYLILRKKGVAA